MTLVGGSLVGPKPGCRKPDEREKGRKPSMGVSRLKGRAMEDARLVRSSS